MQVEGQLGDGHMDHPHSWWPCLSAGLPSSPHRSSSREQADEREISQAVAGKQLEVTAKRHLQPHSQGLGPERVQVMNAHLIGTEGHPNL